MPLYFCPVVSSIYLLLLSFFLACSQLSQTGCLPYFHTWRGLSANLGCRSETCCTQLAENTGHKKFPKILHLGTIIAQLCRAISSQLNHISTVGKKLVKQQYLPHMSSQSGELRPTSGWDRFVSLASLLQRRCSMEANQTLHDVWPFPGLVHYIYIFGALARCKIHFASNSCALLYYQRYCTALE